MPQPNTEPTPLGAPAPEPGDNPSPSPGGAHGTIPTQTPQAPTLPQEVPPGDAPKPQLPIERRPEE